MKLVILVSIVALFLLAGCAQSVNLMSKDPALEQQVVRVGLGPRGYVFNPAKVVVDKPVRLVNDGSVQGCAMFMMQPELGVQANFMQAKEYVFTPKKTGVFTMACSMGMYRGVLEVTAQ